jgi:hypothetical protein
MRRVCLIAGMLLVTLPSVAQSKRLWVLREPGEMVEYDPTTFAVKARVKVPPQALRSPENISVNQPGQILLVPSTTPLIDY